MRILIASVLLVAACTKTNNNYCPGVENNHCMNAPDAPKQCTSDCVCLLPDNVCVQCTPEETRNCSTNQPVCDTSNYHCRGCTSNDDCGMGACLETGACSSPNEVLYASPTGASTGGCGTTPAQACSITQALIEVGGARPIIRLAPGMYSVTMNEPDGLNVTKNATLAARGSTVTRTSGAGPLATVRPGQTLKLIGGKLQGPLASDGIRCDTGTLQIFESVIDNLQAIGIASNSCELTISRATFRDNDQGGINMTGLAKIATITNNIVYRNGGAGSQIGGMALRLVHPGSRLEFNTVADNNAAIMNGTAGGILCVGPGYTSPFNLIYRNVGGLDGMYQVEGTCTFAGSYQKAAATPAENMVFFENPTGPNPSYRLTAMSPIGVGGVVDVLDCRDEIDFEGDPRPQPAGTTKCDMGADEYRMKP